MPRRFIPDPPHVIARNMATAHLLRDPLYGGETKWDGGYKEAREQQQRWALNYRNFCFRPPLYSTEEIQAKSREYAEKFGVSKYEGPAADETLRQRFRTFLREEAVRLGLRERMNAKPTNPMSRACKTRNAVIETLRKIEVAERAPQRKEKSRELSHAGWLRNKVRYHRDPEFRKRWNARTYAWAKRNPEKVRARRARFHAAHPEKRAEYARRLAAKRKAMRNALAS